ncbi:MAG: PilZ domain-containing protein [Candidatus Omnitrophica bacterium]|nr:PilZ domain-containing protein [Candidatus Omnitrophota bacterium]
MENKYKGSNRRRSERVRVAFTLIYQIDKPLHVVMLIGGREINALMADISDLGMAILTNCNIPATTALLIKFTLINPYATAADRIKSMEMQGEVRSNVLLKDGNRRLGICFTKISKEYKSAISGFVNKKIKSTNL